MYYLPDIASMSTKRIELELMWHYKMEEVGALHPMELPRKEELIKEYAKRVLE